MHFFRKPRAKTTKDTKEHEGQAISIQQPAPGKFRSETIQGKSRLNVSQRSRRFLDCKATPRLSCSFVSFVVKALLGVPLCPLR
jgi:hypothetical protein